VSVIKVLLIGLDGATWNLIKPWADKGELPVFKKLMVSGVWGELESTIPPYTIPAWLSLSTGKTPETLRVYSFMVKRGYQFRPYFMVREPEVKVWDLLSYNGKRVCILNPPDVHYTYKINGIMVAGFLCISRERLTYPLNLLDQLNAITEGYEIDTVTIDFKSGKPRPKRIGELTLNQVLKVHNKQFKAFTYLMKKEKADFSYMVFTILDRIQHAYWGNKRKLLNCYKLIDRQLGELIELMDEDTILIIVSDHGFTSLKRNFYINDFLIKEGYLTLRNKKKSNLVIKIRNLLCSKDILRQLSLIIFNKLPLTIKEEYFKRTSYRITDVQVDWEKTKAFAFSGLGEIYLNVKGREPHGVISKNDYEKIRREISEKLKNIRDPTSGQKISVNVILVHKKDLTKDDTPDLIIVETEEFNVSPLIGYGSIIENYKKPIYGQHSRKGIFLAYGSNIRKGVRISGVRIYDIAPTILHIFNIPIPIEMNGRVIKEIFETNSALAKQEVSYTKSIPIREKIKKKIEKLKCLGSARK